MTPLVSVLCPTRGRQGALAASMDSLLSKAAPGRAEVLLAIDPDEAHEYCMALPGQVSVWVAPERHGYAQLHKYLNALAERARGEWLLLWNDDCTMLTPGWDQVIAGEAPGILWPEADYAPQINTFPVIPRAWFEHLGHLSLDQSCDMWLHDLGDRAGLMRKIPVAIHHAHATGDATARERDAAANVMTFHAPQMAEARQQDAARLRELLG